MQLHHAAPVNNMLDLKTWRIDEFDIYMPEYLYHLLELGSKDLLHHNLYIALAILMLPLSKTAVNTSDSKKSGGKQHNVARTTT